MTLDFTPAAAGEENLEYLEFLNLESSGHLILAKKLGCTFDSQAPKARHRYFVAYHKRQISLMTSEVLVFSAQPIGAQACGVEHQRKRQRGAGPFPEQHGRLPHRVVEEEEEGEEEEEEEEEEEAARLPL